MTDKRLERTTSDLVRLAERCEKAQGPDRELFIAAYAVIFPDGYRQGRSGYNYDR